MGYITAAVVNPVDSQDVLQKTNLALWKNYASYDPTRPFLPWALTLARYAILGFYRDRKRDRLVFDNDVLEQLLQRAEEKLERLPRRQIALRQCLAKLKDDQRTILALYYAHRKSIAQISELTGRTADSIKSLMRRLRQGLRECIRTRLSQSTS